MNTGPVKILIVDDDDADVMLTREALENSGFEILLNVVHDGVAAMRFLRKEGEYAEEATPDLVFLDLNMPKMDGHEVLEEVRADEHLKKLPVVVLTTSAERAEVIRTYKLGANCYATKTSDVDEFTRLVQTLQNFWLNVVQIPTRDKR